MKPLAQNSMIQNRYLVVHAIGKGGMGEVYLAVDQRLGSAVALKRTFFADDNELGTAFEREARILARLRHPVLPKVIDHFIEGGDQYLVMEHISGEDLSKRIESANKPFPLSWVMFWADQLLDALTYLHSHEPPIIHRDIKPQNLKLTDDNHIVLLDFGLSKDFDSKSAANPMNSASVAGYSPHFAAMEQIRGTGTDGRSDIFSLSATLYQLLTNQVPLDALSRADGLLGGKPDPVRPISEINPEVPESISAVILRGMAVRQEERFSSASEMQRELRRAFNAGQRANEKTATLPQPPVPKSSEPPRPAAQTERLSAPQGSASSTGSLEKTVAMGTKIPVSSAETKPTEMKTAVLDNADFAPAGVSGDSKTTGNSKANSAAATVALPGVPPTPLAHSAPVAANNPKRSRAGLMIGALIGLLLVAGIAAGGGWFAYQKYYKSDVKVEPTPISAPSPAISNSPVITEPEKADAGETEPSNRPEQADTSATPATIPVSSKATPPTPAKAAPVKKPATSTKATPAKKSDDRTVILQ